MEGGIKTNHIAVQRGRGSNYLLGIITRVSPGSKGGISFNLIAVEGGRGVNYLLDIIRRNLGGGNTIRRYL